MRCIRLSTVLGTITLNRKEWAREERARGREKDGGGGSMEAGDLFHSMISQCHQRSQSCQDMIIRLLKEEDPRRL